MNTFMVKYYTYKMLWSQTGSSRNREINMVPNRWASHYCVSVYVCVSWNVFTGQLFPLGQKLMEKQFLSLRGSKQWLLVIAWALSTRVIRYFVENYFVCSQLPPHFVVSSTHDIRSSAHLVVKVSTHVSLKIPRQLCREKHHLTCCL